MLEPANPGIQSLHRSLYFLELHWGFSWFAAFVTGAFHLDRYPDFLNGKIHRMIKWSKLFFEKRGSFHGKWLMFIHISSSRIAGSDSIRPQLPYPSDGVKALLLRSAASRLVLFTSGREVASTAMAWCLSMRRNLEQIWSGRVNGTVDWLLFIFSLLRTLWMVACGHFLNEG